MTWIPATVEIWVMSCWVAAAVPSALWSKTLAMLEAMEGEATPSPMPDRTRATSTRAMPVFLPGEGEDPHGRHHAEGAGNGGRAFADADGHVAGDGGDREKVRGRGMTSRPAADSPCRRPPRAAAGDRKKPPR